MPFIPFISKPGGFEMNYYPKPKFIIKRKIKESKPYTVADEAVDILTEWYTLRGLVPPPEEIEACRSVEPEPDVPAEPVEVFTKPAYGTPEFWKDWWKKKKAKEAALTAELEKAQEKLANTI